MSTVNQDIFKVEKNQKAQAKYEKYLVNRWQKLQFRKLGPNFTHGLDLEL